MPFVNDCEVRTREQRTLQRWISLKLRQLQKLLKRDPDRRFDVFLYDWNWPDPIPDFGTGRYVYRNGDWVRP